MLNARGGQLKPFRIMLLRNMPMLGMLISYFFTVVLGNLIYASPWGQYVLETTGYPTDLLSFDETFTKGFWALLFLPLVLVPPIFWLSRGVTSQFKSPLMRIPEIGRPEYAVVTTALLVYVAVVFWRDGIASIFGQGKDAISSVEARFLILRTIGLKPMIALHSVLWFLSLYAFVRAIRDRQQFWIAFAFVSCIFVTVCLTLLNMKWPVLIYFLALLLAAFTYSKRPYIASVIWAFILVMAYVGVSASVLRVSADQAFVQPSQEVTASAPLKIEVPVSPNVYVDPANKSLDVDHRKPIEPPKPSEQSSLAVRYLSSLSASALTFVANPFSRMAVPYSYYYHVFTSEGSICGGPFSQIQSHPPCTPTWIIYERIFPKDRQFAGRGSSPAGVNITAYALGGWIGAVLETILAAMLLGFFAGLPLSGSAVLGSIFVTGSIVGYHFSQIPGEGPIIYDYGIAWSFIVVLLLLATTYLRETWRSVS